MAEFAERIKPRAQYVDEAIELALASRWPEAVQLNRTIMERFGPDEDTLNRLGKAYTELGQFDDAIEAYQATLKANPVNPIAHKNLAKLQAMRGGQPVPASKAKVDVDAFIEETGKTALTALHVHAEGDPCSKVSGGDPVKLSVDGDTMNVETVRGVYLGHLEHALGRRLIKFLEGGNRYSGAVATCDGGAVKIIVREAYQDPKFFGRPSFPIKKGREEFRPYAKESLIARGDADESEDDSEEPAEDLDGMHTVEAGEEDVEVPEVDEDTRKEDVY
ncbi:MAG TPA: tetratricopeptide repeat protein [Candidatus Dormibacteraeota bacterium]|nr:tetratricopeptide repeat protein [Candidatus Dormibacteraeota bacterium]